MTTVSVVIPCFNAREWISATLDSVLEQSLPDLDVIVVDDGSTDGSGQLVADSFPGVRLIRTDNGGASRARNIGTRLARGQFIQYLDADDLLVSGKLETQLRVMDEVHADIAYGDWRELRAGPHGSSVPGRLVSPRLGPNADIALLTDFWCPPAAYLFRREIVDRAGGWDEQQIVVEDVRFVLACALQGAGFVYAPGTAAFYRVHASGSLSTRFPVEFTRGCLRNADTVEEWWRRCGGLTPARSATLVQVYGQVARASFARDRTTFEAAYAALERLQPGYKPARPWHLALASRVIGYRSAEGLAVRYRHAKRTLSGAVQLAGR
ncbi:MAG: glycosyltransferase family 2 protein [Chloroflexota bacterium]|nr:glycosyltransferase family 2 protein [Chloroflexota bacterium]